MNISHLAARFSAIAVLLLPTQLAAQSPIATDGAASAGADVGIAALGDTASSETIVVQALPLARSIAIQKARHMLTNSELADERGGQSLVVTNQTLSAITQGNVLNGDFTAGSVSLSDNALSGFNGVGNVLINTGAQVSLQAGMNLTINIGD